MRWKIDECPDANGNWTLREADGTKHGNTETCIATVYGGIMEQELIEAAPLLKEQVKLLRESLAGLCDHQLTSRDREDAIVRGLAALEATEEEA